MDFPFILSGFFANPGNIIKTILDIAIVAYLIYKLLVLIIDTRAEQLLKGLTLLLLFSFLVTYLKLELLLWLLNKMWLMFAIIIPIVFQPELRRILEHLGRGEFFVLPGTAGQDPEIKSMIKEIIMAAQNLAASRTGALIVIARKTGIDELLESGKDIDALVSAPLLLNLFVPNTPLHDGAVVIKDGRIVKAACFVPLSDNPYLDLELGTRHRAGIGITELSDAISLIVSEETGSISLAKNGRINQHLDINTLKELLEQELLSQENSGRKGWFKNGPRK